ncbi:REP-associated tyrosine transposase [Texcoconibacillus texcoconensis]|uniref:REP element-mobilizing transposase RayT n=1 Tax=Texcoconibacillus texcoconensis TaxID=1095777 RepID=A0A840QT95_9BACI|nr:transposase [Texcoconibacillus texcoconensis]MBB5174584.1 REP element-mobilizing transposase RayT [Texcoconibacillus texcoconensis]
MGRKPRSKSAYGIYHIMWRGANGQEIFHDDEDRMRFLGTFLKCKIQAEMTVYAWCLMSNHVHLLVREGNEDISLTMKRIGVSFALYYNWKYRTQGHLFQDRFKSENVESRRYFLTVVRYIHQNPVKAGMVNQVDQWPWSSCLGYYNEEVYPERLLDTGLALKMFSTDLATARATFKVFNERKTSDQCLDETAYRRRLSDEEARVEIKKVLGSIEIPQVKSLPKVSRNHLLRKVKAIEGISQRQAARILGVSPNFVYKA